MFVWQHSCIRAYLSRPRWQQRHSIQLSAELHQNHTGSGAALGYIWWGRLHQDLTGKRATLGFSQQHNCFRVQLTAQQNYDLAGSRAAQGYKWQQSCIRIQMAAELHQDPIFRYSFICRQLAVGLHEDVFRRQIGCIRVQLAAELHQNIAAAQLQQGPVEGMFNWVLHESVSLWWTEYQGWNQPQETCEK